MQRPLVRLLASVGAASGITFILFLLRPPGLDVHTDIVGYPTFANFDIDELLWNYVLVVVVLPVLAIALYIGVTRLAVGRSSPWLPLPAPSAQLEEIPAIVRWRTWAVAFGRTLLVGLVGGLELAIVLERGVGFLLAAGIVYAAAVLGLATLLARPLARDGFAVASAVNVLAAPFLVAGLWALSQATEVRVTGSGDVHRYPWFPGWLALAAAAVLLVAVVLALRTRRRPAGQVERLTALLVVAPVGLFVLLADLPGELGTFDSYEEGQALAAAGLVREGSFPWRDLMLTHGLLSDVLRGLVGFAVFDESRWGLVAGDEVLFVPLAWVALYYLCAYLFWTNWVFLLGTQLLVVTGVVTAIETRFLLVPFVLLLLVALLMKPSVVRAAAFAVVLFVQLVVTPEALVAAAAAVATLMAFEFSYDGRRFRRTALCLGTALALASAWALFLAAFGALDDWAFALASVVPGHRLTGGIPLGVERTQFEVVAPVVAVLVVYAFVAFRVRLRRPFAYGDWIMVAMALLTLLYYAKFLSRADAFHLEHSFAVAVPLLFYLAFRAVTFGEAWLRARLSAFAWFPRRHTLTVPIMVGFVVFAPTPVYDVVDGAPRHFSAGASEEPRVGRIGYARPGENDVDAVESLGRALDALVEPGGTVFDFANAPGLSHFVLGRTPSTRYYHVSFAIRRRSQSDLVRELEVEPAAAVVVATTRTFTDLPAWDEVSNQVRHYDVSEHLLDEYVPVKAVEGFVLLAPRASGAEADPDLYFRVDPCDWGYVPSFLSVEPGDDVSSQRLPVRRSPDRKRFVVTLPPGAAEYGWLEVETGAPPAEGRFELTDRPGGGSRRTIRWSTLAGEDVVRVKVGACSQWHGYRPGPVYLTTSVPQDIDEIRLVR